MEGGCSLCMNLQCRLGWMLLLLLLLLVVASLASEPPGLCGGRDTRLLLLQLCVCACAASGSVLDAPQSVQVPAFENSRSQCMTHAFVRCCVCVSVCVCAGGGSGYHGVVVGVLVCLWWGDTERGGGHQTAGMMWRGRGQKAFFNKLPRTSANTQVPLSDFFFVLNSGGILMQRPHFHARHRGTFLWCRPSCSAAAQTTTEHKLCSKNTTVRSTAKRVRPKTWYQKPVDTKWQLPARFNF